MTILNEVTPRQANSLLTGILPMLFVMLCENFGATEPAGYLAAKPFNPRDPNDGRTGHWGLP